MKKYVYVLFQGLEFGNVAKIYLHFPEPWWEIEATNSPFSVAFHWTENDKNEFANDVCVLLNFI